MNVRVFRAPPGALWSAVAPATAFPHVIQSGGCFGQRTDCHRLADPLRLTLGYLEATVFQSGGWRHRTPKRFARNGFGVGA
jgi:hypothetical protein